MDSSDSDAHALLRSKISNDGFLGFLADFDAFLKQIDLQKDRKPKRRHSVSTGEPEDIPSPTQGKTRLFPFHEQSPMLSQEDFFQSFATALLGKEIVDIVRDALPPQENVSQKRKAITQVPSKSSVPEDFSDSSEDLSLNLTTKRRRLGDHIESNVSLPTRDVGAHGETSDEDCIDGIPILDGIEGRPNREHEEGGPTVFHRSRAHDASRTEFMITPSPDKMKTPVYQASRRHKRCDAPNDDSSSEAAGSQASEVEESLSQGQIQSNYQEFLKSSEGKVAEQKLDTDGAKSEDDERMAYEKIFLGNSPAED